MADSTQDQSRIESPLRSGRIPPLVVDTELEPEVAHEGVLDPEELPFDQYDRYRFVADLCRGLARPDETLHVLDVGGRTGILRQFLSDARVDLVDLATAETDGLVLGAGDRLPFATDSVDVVAAADTLEHVPPSKREAFVRECCRVARRAAVIAGPYRAPKVDEAEEILQAFLREKLKLEHDYLNEHRDHGLPDRNLVEAQCRAAGARDVAVFGKSNLDRWLSLVTLAMVLDERPQMRRISRRLCRLLNEPLYVSDPHGVVYRHGVVALFGDTPAPTTAPVAPRDVEGAWLLPLAHVSTELLAFDQRRDVFELEKARLEGVIQRMANDLNGHRTVSLELAADLEQHQKSLDEARELLEQTSEVLEETRGDLAEHGKTLAAERAERAGERESYERIAEELGGEIRAHQVEREGLITEMGALRAHAAAVEAELLHKTRWRRKIRRWLRLDRS